MGGLYEYHSWSNNVKKKCRMAVFAVLVVFFFRVMPVFAQTREARAAAVLFDNFETVFHTSPSLVSDSPNDIRSGFPREPFGFLLAGLDAIGPQVRVDVLENSEAILVGTKDYHLPIGLGRVRSTRCYVVVLRKGSALNLSQFFKTVEVGRRQEARQFGTGQRTSENSVTLTLGPARSSRLRWRSPTSCFPMTLRNC